MFFIVYIPRSDFKFFMDMDEMGFYSLDEQAIKQEVAYKKKIFLQQIYCFSLLHFCA